MAASYIEMFEEEIYPPAFEIFAAGVVESFDLNQEKVIRSLKATMDGYMDQLCRRQEAGLAGSVAQIILSLLYTTVGEKGVEFQIDSYEEEGFLYGEILLSERFTVSWLGGELSLLTELLKKRVAEERLGRYIRPAQLERMKLRVLGSLLSYFASRFRYLAWDILDRKQLAKLKKEETFTLSMGEYRDWQKVIFALRPAVDIFNCEPTTDFIFRSFPAVYYEKKSFQKLDICNTRFTDCTFRDCVLEECRINDCIFDGCSFQNVLFGNTQMRACLLLDSSFCECRFQEVDFSSEQSRIPGNREGEIYYEPAEFLACAITECTMTNSDLRNVLVKDCDLHDLVLEASVVDGLGFGQEEMISLKE